MTNKDLNGLVYLMKADKSLIATKRIRVYQRESCADNLCFLIPFSYEDKDLTKFTVMLQYLGVDQTIHAETLVRSPEDYEDADGNVTHMIYQLPIDSELTKFAGDLTIKLNLDYMDMEGQTDGGNDEAPAPTPIHYVINTDSTILTILPVADYYSFVPDESLSLINNKIAELNTKTAELEALAHQFTDEQVDNIVLVTDPETGEIHLSSKGNKIGDGIGLRDLNDALNEYNDGVITDPTDPSDPTNP